MSEYQHRPEVPGHRVEAVIGAGSSGVVWSGRDAAGRPVAIKVPHEGLDAGDLAQQRVEQHVLKAVRHEHLVPLRDVVTMPDGRTALVFDLVRGQVLRGMVRSRGHLRPGEIVTALTPVCEAVAALHSAGGLHADISPGNITVAPDGRPTLLDLGAARLAGRASGVVHGTPGFIAPEVRAGDDPSEASDVYALGAVAWFCATGNGAPDTPLRLDPVVVESHVGRALAVVIGACIDPDPDRRPSSAELPRLFYDAAPAEPIEVVVEADPAAALTRRLRDAASRDAEVGAVGLSEGPAWRVLRVPHRWHRVGALVLAVIVPLLAGAGWALAARKPPQGGPVQPVPSVVVPGASRARPAPSQAVPSRSQGVPGASPAVSGASLAGPGAGVAAPGASLAVPGPSRTALGGSHAPPVPGATGLAGASPVPTGPIVDPAQVVLDPRSPSVRPVVLLQALSDRRARALASRDAAALTAVHRAGSPSLVADERLVESLRRAGVRWEALRLEVWRAGFASGTSRHAVVHARVGWAAYTVVGVDGSRTTEPAARGEVLDFHLVRTEAGWRIESVIAARAR